MLKGKKIALGVGGNVDYERFLEEVLQPLTQKRDVLYRPFACSTREL